LYNGNGNIVCSGTALNNTRIVTRHKLDWLNAE
jgi:hypothetical protein